MRILENGKRRVRFKVVPVVAGSGRGKNRSSVCQRGMSNSFVDLLARIVSQ